MERKDKHNEANTEKKERPLDQDREQSDDLMQLPALELLQSPFAFLCTEMRYRVRSPPTIELLQPPFHEHREECIDQNEREAEEEEHVHCSRTGGDLKGSGLKRRDCSVTELLRNVDKHVHCDVGAVCLELGNQEYQEGGKKCCK